MIILRHDIDNAYSNKYLLLAHMKGALPRFYGYLRTTEMLLRFEMDYGMHSTWFFRRVTRPSSKLRLELERCGNEIGFHADRIHVQSAFAYDLQKALNGAGCLGFTKHGHKGLKTDSSIGGEGENYSLELCIERGEQYHLKYFSGNEPYDGQAPYRHRNLVVFPSMFSLVPGYMKGEYTLDWLAQNQNKDIVVVVHPEDFLKYPEVVKGFYERCRFVSFEEYLAGYAGRRL